MAFPVLFDTFVEKVKHESESSAVALEEAYLLLSQQIDEIRGIDPEVVKTFDVALTTMANAAVTCREWSDKLNSFSVLPRSRGDVEIDSASVMKLAKECQKLHDLVADNIKSIAASQVMKNKAHIDLTERDAALTHQYVADGYKLSAETLERFKLTFQGARARLIKAGAWRANK